MLPIILKLLTPKVIKAIIAYVFEKNELDERISKLKLPPPRYNSGVLYKYSKLVSGSDKGAVTN